MIDSTPKAGRYLAELAATTGFDEALRRVRARATPDVARDLDTLQRYIDGDSAVGPGAELALYAELVRRMPDRAEPGPGLTEMQSATAEARTLASEVRAGVLGTVVYSALLLSMVAALSALWLLEIAPAFVAMFAQFGTGLPAFSQALVDLPWLPFALVAVLAGLLALVVIGRRRIAAAIETLAPVTAVRLVPGYGARLRRAHDRWRAATLASAWAAGGREPSQAYEEALETSAAHASAPAEGADDLTLACELGNGREELAYQRGRMLDAYRARLALHRSVSLRIVQVLIAALVGAVTIAIYLPLFQTGTVI